MEIHRHTTPQKTGERDIDSEQTEDFYLWMVLKRKWIHVNCQQTIQNVNQITFSLSLSFSFTLLLHLWVSVYTINWLYQFMTTKNDRWNSKLTTTNDDEEHSGQVNLRVKKRKKDTHIKECEQVNTRKCANAHQLQWQEIVRIVFGTKEWREYPNSTLHLYRYTGRYMTITKQCRSTITPLYRNDNHRSNGSEEKSETDQIQTHMHNTYTSETEITSKTLRRRKNLADRKWDWSPKFHINIAIYLISWRTQKNCVVSRAPCVRILNMIQFYFDLLCSVCVWWFFCDCCFFVIVVVDICFLLEHTFRATVSIVFQSRVLDCCLNRFYHHHYRQCSSREH